MQYIWGNLHRERGKGRELELDSAALLFVSILVREAREGDTKLEHLGGKSWQPAWKLVSHIRGDNQLLLQGLNPGPAAMLLCVVIVVSQLKFEGVTRLICNCTLTKTHSFGWEDCLCDCFYYPTMWAAAHCLQSLSWLQIVPVEDSIRSVSTQGFYKMRCHK